MDSEPDQKEERAQALVGTVIEGRYRIDSLVGLGMMGAVYRAHHEGLGRDVAVKILHEELMADAEMVGRFKREAAAISRLDHPNCVRVTDFGELKTGGMFIAMELLQGRELAKMLDQPIPYERAMQIGSEVLSGLQHAHEQGVIHRDIKPENVFIARNSDGAEQVKILDFGIAKVQEGFGSRTLTQAGMVFGTPHYMSPEQCRGTPLDHRADLYSVGILLYDLVAGHVPFDAADPVKLLRKQITEKPPPLPIGVPEPVRAVILKMLEKDPDDRPTSAAEAKASIERAVLLAKASAKSAAETADAAPRSGLTQVVDTGTTGNQRMVFALIGASIFVTIAFMVWLVAASDDKPAEDPVAAVGKQADGDSELGDASEPAESKSDDGTPRAPETPRPEPTEELPEKALRANLAGIDAFIAAKDFGAAHTSIKPVLEEYPQSAPHLWRLGLVMTKLKGAGNRVTAIESYAAALASRPLLLHKDAFKRQLDTLLDDPALRPQAIEIAMEHLGEAGLIRLAAWVNLQHAPLQYSPRHEVINFLEDKHRGDSINRPLQLALDLWQASDAGYPCAAFESALKDVEKNTDSYLHGTLRAVGVPQTKGEAPAPCEGMEDALKRLRERYDLIYAGLDPTVPAHFRKRRRRK